MKLATVFRTDEQQLRYGMVALMLDFPDNEPDTAIEIYMEIRAREDRTIGLHKVEIQQFDSYGQ